MATEAQVKDLTLTLMSEHGLHWPAWGFRFSKSKLVLGRCEWNRYNGGTIIISRHFLHNPIEEVRDTILHEIAHALAGPGNGHNHVWKEICRRIGAKPLAKADHRVERPEFKWTGVCINGHTCKRHALTERGKRMSCGKCCRALNNGQWSAKFLFEWHLTEDLKKSGKSGVRLHTQQEVASQEPTRISELVAAGF